MLTFNEWKSQQNKEAAKGVPAFRSYSYNEKYFKKGVEVLSGFAFGNLSYMKYNPRFAGKKDVYGSKDVDSRNYIYPRE
jgi:hypothetical protein